MSVSIRWAKVTTQFEGFHRYENAPIPVAFLSNIHRHMFHVTVWIEQFHNERDVEYILFKRLVIKWIENHQENHTLLGSCETVAEGLGVVVLENYPGRRVMVEVTEDGENGALLEME